MSESANSQPDATPPAQSDAATESPRTFSQDQVNALVAEERRKTTAKFSDYQDLQAAKTRLDELEMQSKTKEEQLAERVSKAEAELTTTRAQAVRAQIAAKHSLPLELITGTDETQCEAQAKALEEFMKTRNPAGPTSSSLGDPTTAPGLNSEQLEIDLRRKLGI